MAPKRGMTGLEGSKKHLSSNVDRLLIETAIDLDIQVGELAPQLAHLTSVACSVVRRAVLLTTRS